METSSHETEVKVKNVRAERDELRSETRRLFQTLLRTGAALLSLPVSMLPHESQTHLRAAGREFTRGVASLSREVADALEKAAEEQHTHRE